MNKAPLDTDTYSEVLKAINPNVTRNAAMYHQRHGVYTLSVVSVMEIVYGLQRVQRDRHVREFLAAVVRDEVIPFEFPAAELAGRIAGALDSAGQTIGKADPMIAAIALHHGLDLVTGNTSHYQRVQRLGYPLTLSNWREWGRRPPSGRDHGDPP